MELKNTFGVAYLLCGWALLFIANQAVDARLLNSPRDTIVVAGQSININCSSDITEKSFVWYWSQARQPSVIEIYDNGIKIKSARFTFTETASSDSRSCHLTIAPVEIDDGGTVYCRDDAGFGDYKSAQITVLKDPPSCTIHNFHYLVTMLCSFRYWGKQNLKARWNLKVDNTTVIHINKSERIFPGEDIIEHSTILTFNHTCGEQHRLIVNVTLLEYSFSGSTEYSSIADLKNENICPNDISAVTDITTSNSNWLHTKFQLAASSSKLDKDQIIKWIFVLAVISPYTCS